MRVFDLHRPGRDFGQHSTLQGNKEGQTGYYLRFSSPSDNVLLFIDQGYLLTIGPDQASYLRLLFLLHIVECLLWVLIARQLESIGKTIWNCYMSCMVKKEELHM